MRALEPGEPGRDAVCGEAAGVEVLGPEINFTDLLLARGAGSLEDDALIVKVVSRTPILVLVESTGNVSGGSAALPLRNRGLRIADPTGISFVFSLPRWRGFPLRDKAKALTVSGLSLCLGVDCLNAVYGGMPGQASTLVRGSLGQGEAMAGWSSRASNVGESRSHCAFGAGGRYWVVPISGSRSLLSLVGFAGGIAPSRFREARLRRPPDGRLVGVLAQADGGARGSGEGSRVAAYRFAWAMAAPGATATKRHAQEHFRGLFEAVAGSHSREVLDDRVSRMFSGDGDLSTCKGTGRTTGQNAKAVGRPGRAIEAYSKKGKKHVLWLLGSAPPLRCIPDGASSSRCVRWHRESESSAGCGT